METPTPMMKMSGSRLRLAWVVFGCALVVALGLGVSYVRAVYTGVRAWQTEEVTMDVAQGAGASRIAETLEERGVITRAVWFKVYVRLHGLQTALQPGTYTFAKGTSIADVVDTLTGIVIPTEKTLRIIEGWTLHDIAVAVERAGFGTREDFLKVTGKPATDYRLEPAMAPSIDWAKEFPLLADKPSYVSLEGYLFPDTYRFALDAKPEDVVRRLLKEFEKKFDAAFIAEAQRQKISIFDVVTMASVIEKEVNGDIDRAKVSDLLWRRYDINWALQCDSTVKYATGNFGDTPFTTAADRASQSEYNTYQHPGLPLGPIANPGMSSIRAALYPLANDAWFFLTTPDGEVKYGETLEEHVANKRFMR